MTIVPEWEALYRSGAHDSRWPWSDLVSLVRRHCRHVGPHIRVLELGCGVGANVPFFRSLGADYFAIEGSRAAVDRLHQEFPELQDRIVCADFTRPHPFPHRFDLIADRASVTCNSTAAICAAIDAAWQVMVPGGAFVGVDWYSTNHTDYAGGKVDGDPFTRNWYTHGQFSNMGRVHFSDETHLRQLFARFDFLYLEEKQVRRHLPDGGGVMAAWNFVVRKPDA